MMTVCQAFILLLSITMTTQAKDGVILLHGLCRSASSMNKMEKGLEAAGFITVNKGYPSRKESISKLSESTIGDALKDPRLAGCRKIHFVTHSMGGIMVRVYFKRHPDKNVGRVVMLGPPNQGSEVVDRIGHWWVFKKLNGPAGGQLGTAKDSVPNQLGKVPFELGVIAGNKSINWINSLMIKGDDDGKVSLDSARVDGMKEMVVVPFTHPFIMKRKRVIALTIHFLKFGTFGKD